MSMQVHVSPGQLVLPGGKSVSRIGVGCWAIGGPDHNLGLPMGWSTANDDAARRGLDTAYGLGANLFDTADVYGHGHSERLLGEFLRHVPRNAVAVASKVGYFTGTAAHAYEPLHMRHQLEQTLHNLGSDDIFTFVAQRGAVVLVDKPLGQGLLTGKYDRQQAPMFGAGDHRRRKRWFTPAALAILRQELAPLRERFGTQSADLIRVALRYCLRPGTVLIVGFTRPEQVVENLTCLGEPLTIADVDFIAKAGQRAQKALDAAGEVFLDEVAAESDRMGEADR